MGRTIEAWLAEHRLESLGAIMRANDVDLDILKDLSEQELAELGISIGNRKRLLKALADGPPGPTLSETRMSGMGMRSDIDRREWKLSWVKVFAVFALGNPIAEVPDRQAWAANRTGRFVNPPGG